MISIANDVFEGSHIWVFNKTNLYAGNFTAPTLLAHTNSATAGSEVPAVTYDNSLSTLHLLQNANGNTNGNGYLRLFSISGAIGSETLNNVTNPIYIQVTNTWADKVPSSAQWTCCFAPQSNSTLRIGIVEDARLLKLERSRPCESARGLAHSKTWRTSEAADGREASWSAVALYRFRTVQPRPNG